MIGIILSLQRCKLKEWDTSTYLLERLKSKTGTKSNAGENMEHEELLITAGGNIKWNSHFEKQFGIFFNKAKHILTYDSAIAHLVINRSEMKSFSTQNLHKKVYSIFNYSCKNWKQTICSSRDKWINNVVHLCNGIIFWKRKKKYGIKPKKRWKQCMFLSERNQPEKATYCVIPSIWQGKHYDDRKRPAARRWVEARRRKGCMHRWSSRDF